MRMKLLWTSFILCRRSAGEGAKEQVKLLAVLCGVNVKNEDDYLSKINWRMWESNPRPRAC